MKRLNPTFLIVDDDPNDLMLIQSAFVAAGIISKIQTVNSGNEAIAYLSGEQPYGDRGVHAYPDFVITDLKMPNGDGFSVLEHFKQNPEWAVVPTIILSGAQDNDDIKKAYLLGASAYHVKPSSPNALRGLVKLLYDYWQMCEVPGANTSGKQVESNGTHKIGQRFVRHEKI